MEVKKINRIRLDKKDYLRVLLTDTAPSDVPIIFSNDGFYINSHRAEKDDQSILGEIISILYRNIIDFRKNSRFINEEEKQKEQKKQSHPLKFRIIKNETNLRTLSLLHPRAQLNFAIFYAKYSDAIVYLCSLSDFSVRAPQKVGGSLYIHDFDENKKYKEVNIDTLEHELKRKHASSFFSYRGYDRIYKLFNDIKYISLEKKFTNLHFLDIANCFDSIYTHSISWAVKNKDFIKDHVEFTNQFCQLFDTYMQRCNNNETNGIPVGAEVSRIFAEIIFQSIDARISILLQDHYGYKYNQDYVIMRYVDDYIVFSKNSNITSNITATISDCLGNYNLYLGKDKTKAYDRPFCTEKSSIIIELNEEVKFLENKLYSASQEDDVKSFKINKINKRKRVFHSFVDKIKKICVDNKKGYGEVSSYLISVFSKRIIAILNQVRKEKNILPESDDALNIRNVASLFLDFMFFFYSVYPTVPSSNIMAKTIIIADDFFIDEYPQFSDFIRAEIMSNINMLSFDENINNYRHGYISLEKLNIILSTSKFGKNYLLPASKFKLMLDNKRDINYFDIVSLLYYFQDHIEYKESRDLLESIIRSKILIGNIKPSQDSESAHLILDLTTCPYISRNLRRDILESFFKIAGFTCSLNNIDSYINSLQNTFWFVKWKELDLIKLLERKELKSIY